MAKSRRMRWMSRAKRPIWPRACKGLQSPIRSSSRPKPGGRSATCSSGAILGRCGSAACATRFARGKSSAPNWWRAVMTRSTTLDWRRCSAATICARSFSHVGARRVPARAGWCWSRAKPVSANPEWLRRSSRLPVNARRCAISVLRIGKDRRCIRASSSSNGRPASRAGIRTRPGSTSSKRRFPALPSRTRDCSPSSSMCPPTAGLPCRHSRRK